MAAKKLSIHPICNIFPSMDDEAFDKLKADIKENGQSETITLDATGKTIIDGKHRYRACCELKIKPRTARWNGKGSMIAFAISKNLHRRHLDASQRAMVAAELATLNHGQKKSDMQNCISQTEAAEALGVSVRTVADATTVKKEGAAPLVEAVKQGDVPVSVASSIAQLPTQQQIKAMRHATNTEGEIDVKKLKAAAPKKPKITADSVREATRNLRSGKEVITPGMRKQAMSFYGKLVRMLDKMKLSASLGTHLDAIAKALKGA